MVRTENESPEERFEALLERLVEEHSLRLDITGWSRKTYDIYDGGDRHATRRLLLRVESYTLTSGEIDLFDPSAEPLALSIGQALESDFGIPEAVIRTHQMGSDTD
jgi:hypothetical protein